MPEPANEHVTIYEWLEGIEIINLDTLELIPPEFVNVEEGIDIDEVFLWDDGETTYDCIARVAPTSIALRPKTPTE